MRVLFYCWEFPPNGTGVGGYISAMSRALVSAGHHVVVVTGKAAGCPDVEEGSCGRIYRLYERGEVGLQATHDRVLQIAMDEQVDWIEGADHLGEAAGLFSRRDRPPVIIKVHNSNPVDVVRRAEVYSFWQRPLIRLSLLRQWRQYRAERLSFCRANLLLAPSQRLKSELVRQGLVVENQVLVIPNPVALCEPGGEKSKNPVILFVGRISIGKGIEYLPAMMRRVLVSYPDAILEIAGGDAYARGLGSLRRWLESTLGDIRPSVRFHGKLGPEALDAAYRRAWVLILPSRWDNFPNAVLDAMVRGIPVVASPHGGMTEMLEETGSPVADPATPAFAAAVCDLLGEEKLRMRIGAALRQRALALYHPSVVAGRYVDEVARILE